MSLELTAPAPKEPSIAVDGTWFEYIVCGAQFAPSEDVRYTCDDYDGLLEVRCASPPTWGDFEGRGVWHYNAALPFEEGASLPEGATPLHEVPRLETDVGVETLHVRHEGVNPIGSLKDRGITVDIRVAKELGISRLAYASTDNISTALTAYDAYGGMETLMLLPTEKIVAGKITQTPLHDARILEVDGNFDPYLDIVQNLVARGEAYLLSSLNSFRLKDQRTVGLGILEELHEDYDNYPGRIVLPVGNASNTSTLYKAFREPVQSSALSIDDVSKLTSIQAKGVAPMVEVIENSWDETRHWGDIETCATTIHIGSPANTPKTLPGIREADGAAVAVSDEEIAAMQRDLATKDIGIEPAPVASIVGLRRLRAEGVVDTDEQVICLTTGHLLKDPDATFEADDSPEPVPNDTEAVLEHLAE